MSYPTLEAALEYAALGFRVLPLKPGTKIPDLRHWPEEASSDPATIERQFAQSHARAPRDHPDQQGRTPNVGIATGAGLAVLDIDTKHGGERPAWAPETLEARTPSGGTHLFYAVSQPVPNSVGRVAPGVDVRGERGQVAAAPSIIEDDRWGPTPSARLPRLVRYEWVNSLPIVSLDPWLLTPEDLKRDFAGVRRRFEWRDAVPVGERNNYLTSYAGWLFNQGEDRGNVLHELELEAERLGFSPRAGELSAIARSVSRYHS